jgi:hypothetical protein
MLKSIDITIHQDWNKIRKAYQSVLAMKKDNQLKKRHFLDELTTQHYPLGDLGNLYYEDYGIYSKDWFSLSGKIIDEQLPWLAQARRVFADLHFWGCQLNVSRTSMRPHRDPVDIDKKTGFRMFKFLYIIAAEDPDAITLSYDKTDSTLIYSHKSVPDTAFLLDPYSLHEMKTNGHREILEFTFYNEYDTLAKFFDQTGPIVFGDPIDKTL